jgi:hypothetical protein
MTSDIKRPKRKPDLVLTSTEDLTPEWSEVVKIWFKELIMHVGTSCNNKGFNDSSLYLIDRFESLKKEFRWLYYPVYNGHVGVGEDCFDLDFETKDLNKKLEKAYQDWLATKELEKLLKKGSSKNGTRVKKD